MGDLLAGKIVLVTGAGKGIGRAAAQVFAREGATLVLAGQTLGSVQSALADAGGKGLALQVDVTNGKQVAAVIDETLSKYGRLDAAFNNAGVDGVLAPIADYPEDDFDHVIAVNLKGVWNCMRYEIPALLKNGGGAIVNNASSLAEVGQYNMPAYCGSKAGVLGLTRNAAMDYGAQGIRVNALSPGVTETPMMLTQMDNIPGFRDLLVSKHAIGRLARPEEIAETAAWMLSDRSTFMLGANIAVDGGYTVM
jgi:A-factor type gamma-butyrolactone 1'-reductase (1S-forming)